MKNYISTKKQVTRKHSKSAIRYNRRYALKRIHEAAIIGAKTLDLSFLALEKIPEQIKELSNLEQLYLSGNSIQNLTLLTKLTKLRILYIGGNQIRDITPLKELIFLEDVELSQNHILDISPLKKLSNINKLYLRGNFIRDVMPLMELWNLERLNLADNHLTDIVSLQDLKKLKRLNLSRNLLHNLDWLENITGIEDLDLSGNNIGDIKKIAGIESLKVLNLDNLGFNDPSPISTLKNLIDLTLANNKIENIDFLRQLTSLKILDLRSNQITDISALGNLRNLITLDLSNNNISSLSPWIAQSRMSIELQNPAKTKFDLTGSLWKLKLEHNPILTPPIDIIKEGKKSIGDYFNQISEEQGKSDHLFEAKLLVLGEGGTGKTTFIRKIQNEKAPLPKQSDTTLGIDITKWSYKIPFTKLDLPSVNFHVNLWDFGGQKIYQGTHEIFFSDKSLYVLIADTREQKTDFAYWLNTIEQLGGEHSALLIVLNKKYGHEQKFDERGYRGHFGTLIKDVIELDLSSNYPQIRELQEKVKNALKQLPGIGDTLPLSWVGIREALYKEKANFISFDRFIEICKSHNIHSESTISTLSSYFNRIGVFTHYIRDSVLQERIYLNSNWLVKTVYEILDNKEVKSKKGRLTRKDIDAIWANNELHYEIGKLTKLMHKFGLMYHIDNSDCFVVPAHLSTIKPYSTWKFEGSPNVLFFIYEFDKYMPQGIMSRLIVALNHHIKNHDNVWHRGVNLELNGASAEIIESYGGSNRFEIRIAGSNKIELLAVIRERFAEVLSPFSRLQYKQLIPCTCETCSSSSEPAFHNYDLLLSFREMGVGSQCSKTGRVIEAERLLKIVSQSSNMELLTTTEEHMKIIRIFLASSMELKDDREQFEIFINRENKTLVKTGQFIELILWEDFIDAMSQTRLQDEYNKALASCDIFLSLFFTKVGKFTGEEFGKAYNQFKSSGRPYIYTYFKNFPINSMELKKDDAISKFEFEEKLKELGHFPTEYKNIDDLKYKFKMQLEKLLSSF